MTTFEFGSHAGASFDETLHTTDDGWRLSESGWSPDRSVAVGSNFTVGNGYLGYRAAAAEQLADRFVALVVSDTYDCADGHWRELTTAPNPLFVAASADRRPLSIETATTVESWLDMRSGEFGQRSMHAVGDATVVTTVERFASYDDLHLLAQRWTLTVDRELTVDLEAGIDGEVWSLNGAHLPTLDVDVEGSVPVVSGTTLESGVVVAVAADVTISRGVLVGGATVGEPVEAAAVADARRATSRATVLLAAGASLVVETAAAVHTSNDGELPHAAAAATAERCGGVGYGALRELTTRRWADIWHGTDVRIEGSPLDQAALRSDAYHNRICTPAHTDHLPVGARGSSCQAYQGAAFWDQEIYNLRSFLFTEPEIARQLLVYRHRTLDGARRKAARLGYDGAFYAWISGDTGDELCPDVFFTDVLTGRPIRNHFNVWQIHVSPDIVTTIAEYVDVTGDTEFMIDHGAEIAFEVARFLRSFVRYDDWRGVYHCIRLLGPDEWHENVDDNAFTNHQVHAALGVAIDTWRWLDADHSGRLATLSSQLGLTLDEVEGWQRIMDHLVLPGPDEETGLIEQFAGFFQLEDITPDELRTRLIDPSEYWGWPNGIAVRTQVSKQADVVMLAWLRADRFDDATVRANYEYYEPRCSHNSSLSHTAHGMVAVRIGELERALRHFRAAARVDLLNTNHAVVAGTFIGGIHTAACGGTVQLAVNGFGGLGHRDGRIVIDPALPPGWTALSYPVRWRGLRLTVDIDADRVVVTADPANATAAALSVAGRDVAVEAGVAVVTSRS